MSSSLVHDLKILQESHRYNQWIYSLLEPYLSGVVLDIGSGLGNVVSLFVRPQIEEVILSDCDENLVAQLRKKPLTLRKYRVLLLDVTQDETMKKFKSEKVDTITCINVLEHIKNDIDALRCMYGILKPGGKVVVLVPALEYLYGTLDFCHGHQRRYTQEALRMKMQSSGFHVESWRYMNIFGIFTWFLAGRVLKQRDFSQKTCFHLDKIVPLLRKIERGFCLPWGQSLVMIGQMPK